MSREPKLPDTNPARQPSRREFLTTSGIAVAGGTLGSFVGVCPQCPCGGGHDDTIKIALIGCGGRGTGAAGQAASTSGNVRTSSPWPMCSR